MARAKQSTIALKLSGAWQLAFVVVLSLSFLVDMLLLLHTYTAYGLIGRSTWTYQVIVWSYPIVSAVVGLVFAWPRYRMWLHRIFWAVFLATLGTTVLDTVLALENQIRSANHWYYTGNSPSYWLAFGWEWVTMGICFGLYCGLLWLLGRRKH